MAHARDDYVSTRGSDSATLEEALLRGLARDGGLYVPRELAALPPGSPPATGLGDVGLWAGPTLFPGLSADALSHLMSIALDFPVPLVEVEDGVHVLELFHGPSHAFKDVGARVFAGLARAVSPPGVRRTVLVATSGDTGGAVAAAFQGVESFRVVALFPASGVSERQRRQMTTVGGNVTAVAVHGTFDDCQRLAKEAFHDEDLAERHGLTSANSINIGRLLPQVLYYLHAGALLGWSKPYVFSVPSGNLGNLCAGLIARRMGMRSVRFIAATNSNRSFVDFLEGGEVRSAEVVRTISSAMDVARPSNLERIRWLYRDDLDGLREHVHARSVSDDQTFSTMRAVFERRGYLMDPHTAVAYHAATRHDFRSDDVVVVGTAHPGKFPEVTEAIAGSELPTPPGLRVALTREEHMREIAPTLNALALILAEGAP